MVRIMFRISRIISVGRMTILLRRLLQLWHSDQTQSLQLLEDLDRETTA